MTVTAKQYTIRKVGFSVLARLRGFTPVSQGSGPESLTITQAETSEPATGQVLVIVHAVSLQYRDLIIAEGSYPLP